MNQTTYRILAGGQTVSNNTWDTGLNNNDLVIGPTGSGKTRGYVKPNILQCNESLIVTDTKGSLHKEVGSVLARNGYQVQVIDLVNCLDSPWGYNPLDYIRYDERRECFNEQDILTVAACLAPVLFLKDPFWDYAARMLLGCIISYVMDCLPKEEHTLSSVVQLFRHTGPKGFFERLIGELAQIAPDNFAVVQYGMFQTMSQADKTYSSVQGILAEKLSCFAFSGTEALYQKPNKIFFPNMGNRKTAVFLHLSDTDRSMDRLATLFCTQAMQTLCSYADRHPKHRLKIPVRFILDDFASAADTCIPDFDRIISVIRSREISVSIIVQSLSQLEASYGHDRAMTIVNNCDNLLYLGGQDVETARYVSTKANRSIHSILDMPLEDAWLFTRGQKAREARKFDLQEHPHYQELPEAASRQSRSGCVPMAG